MSPEQAAGRVDAVDTRSDVYALGCVLHELIADRPPHDLTGLPLHEAVRQIVQEPPRSLRGTGVRDGDLETIVGKCLEKEPERRYGSAAELTEDVERYLEARPILARPPSTIYQLQKLVARHRIGFGVTALAFVFLVVFSVTVTIQLAAQRRERARAEAEAAEGGTRHRISP
jgi:serine/threonine protein kinase